MEIKKFRKKIFLLLGMAVLILVVIYNLPEKKKKLHSPHFTFIFNRKINTVKGKELAGALEESYFRIGNDLKTTPAANIETNIYAAGWRYVKATGNWGASGSIEGISKLHFVEQSWSESNSKKVAVHEFAHAVVLKMLIDQEKQPLNAEEFDKRFATFPVWFWEAISCYEAGQIQSLKASLFLLMAPIQT